MEPLLLGHVQTAQLSYLVQSFIWLQEYADRNLYPTQSALQARQQFWPKWTWEQFNGSRLHLDEKKVDRVTSCLLCQTHSKFCNFCDSDFYSLLSSTFRRWLFDLALSFGHVSLAEDLVKAELIHSEWQDQNLDHFCQRFIPGWNFDDLIGLALDHVADTSVVETLMHHHTTSNQTFSTDTICTAIDKASTEGLAIRMLARLELPKPRELRQYLFRRLFSRALNAVRLNFIEALLRREAEADEQTFDANSL
jgi:hypothetical protein